MAVEGECRSFPVTLALNVSIGIICSLSLAVFNVLLCPLSDHLKTEKELAQEKQILNEMLEVVEQRDALVALLEEQRLREKEEDKDLEAVMLSKGFNLNWA